MPFPEPVSWDRKEIYRDRRPVNYESLGNSPVPSRWNRDSPSFSYRGNQHGSGTREFSRRGFTDHRRPPERGRQQSDWKMFPEETGYVYMPSRSCERGIDDRSYWASSSSRVDGRYRNGMDYYKVRGYQNDWEGPNWQRNNSSSSGKPFNGSPVLYGGKPCNGVSDTPVERRQGGMYPGFGTEKHFNASPVICNGRPGNGFSGASVEKSRNGYSHWNPFSPRNEFSPTNISDRPFSSSPAYSGDKECLGYSNPHFDKSWNGVYGPSVVKTHSRINQSFAAERHNNLSTSVSGDRASNVGNEKISPHIAADRSNLISPDISRPCFAPINSAIEKADNMCSNVHSEKTVAECSFCVSAERPIELQSDISNDAPNPGASGAPDEKTPSNITSILVDEDRSYLKLSGAAVMNRCNGLAVEKPGNGVSGESSSNVCDGISRSMVIDSPDVKIDGKLSNNEHASVCLPMISEIPSKQHHDIEVGEITESCDVPKHENENFLGADWKPLLWTRSGSLSSRSSRSIPVESKGAVNESLLIKSTIRCFPSGDAGDCLTSSAASGEEPALKKARLGWGQGLAKYEKKVVEEPCGSGKQDDVRSPKVGDKCSSPSIPTSFACCSSQDADNEFKYTKEIDTLSSLKQSISDNIPFSFENLDLRIIRNEVHLLLKILHSEDQFPTGSRPESTNAMSKLLLWKTGLLKAVEVTDSEIESFESEIQSSKTENRRNFHYPAASSSLNANVVTKSHKAVTACTVMPMPLQVDSSEVRDDIDSPGTATSKPVVASHQVKATLKFEDPRLYSVDISTNFLHTTVKLRHNQEICLPDDSCDSDPPKHCRDNLSCRVHDMLSLEESRLHKFIFAANKEEISKAYDELAHLLSYNGTSIAVCQESVNDMLIRDQVSKRKKLLRFTEEVVTLKYKALHQLWKEDARLLEIRKNRPKSSKRLELGTRTQNTHLKSNLLRSRVSSTEESTRLVPSSQTVSLTSKLLLDCPIKVHELKMPPLILADREKQMSRFFSYNGLVEDPLAVEKERVVLNPWTSDEKEMFLDKYAIFGKDFRKIASYIDHKTTADCVEFYYKNHKSSLIERTRKKFIQLGTHRKSMAKNTYMLTSGGEKWDQERAAADVLAGISSSLSSEVINPCISSSFNHADVQRQWKCKKVSGKRKRSWAQEKVSEVSCSEMDFSSLDWTDEEKRLLLRAVKIYGINFELASKFVKTRYSNECKVFYSKVRKRLGSTLTVTNIINSAAGIGVDSKPDIDVRLSTPLLEPVL